MFHYLCLVLQVVTVDTEARDIREKRKRLAVSMSEMSADMCGDTSPSPVRMHWSPVKHTSES